VWKTTVDQVHARAREGESDSGLWQGDEIDNTSNSRHWLSANSNTFSSLYKRDFPAEFIV